MPEYRVVKSCYLPRYAPEHDGLTYVQEGTVVTLTAAAAGKAGKEFVEPVKSKKATANTERVSRSGHPPLTGEAADGGTP